jgi:ABC-2 type transport system permease protein
VAPITSALLFGLFLLALFSAGVNALSSLYTAADLDLLLSSPITPRRYLFGKTSEILIATSWMFLVFGAPVYLSFGIFFSAGPLYYTCAPIVGLTFLTPAIILGELAAIVLAAFLPAYYGRWFFASLFVGALAFFFATMSGHVFGDVTEPHSLMNQLNATMHYQSTAAGWSGASIDALLNGDLGPTVPTITASLILVGLSWTLLELLFSRVFRRTVSILQSHRSGWNFETRRRGIISRLVLASTPQTERALVTKEFFSFSREATHTVQLIMLLTICVLYLYNFSRIEPPTRVGPEVLRVWDIFLILANVILGSIVLLSICSRFVFPSVSLEGHSFWILQAAPLSIGRILRAKYLGWFVPTSTIATVIFTSGGFALGLEPILVLATTAAGIVICHGLVAVGIGMGARYARFDWEHSAQLTTNSGSLLYMVSGMVLVGINTLPLTVTFGAYILLPGLFRDTLSVSALLGAGLGVLVLVNLLAGYIALRFGARALAAAV